MRASIRAGPSGPLPEALTGHAGYLAVRLGQRAQRMFEEAIAALDLRPGLYDYLATVAERGPLSQRELAAALDIDPARVVAMTDVLQARGILARTADPGDRRRNRICLTKAGHSLAARARGIADRVEADLLAHLSRQEQIDLRALLQRALGLGTNGTTQ